MSAGRGTCHVDVQVVVESARSTINVVLFPN